MSDPKVEPVAASMDASTISIAFALAFVVLTTILILLKFLRSKPKNTFLIAGLSDSGKTLIYSKLINRDSDFCTYTSMKENVYDAFLSPSGQNLRIVDYPGAERLRGGLFDHWLSKELSSVRGVIFVIDSATFSKKVRDVAELLYDVLYQLKQSGQTSTPVLVACSKQDNKLAKNEKLISDSLEREFGLINMSRAAALSSTDGDNQSRVLADSGTDFAWGDLKLKKLKFVPACAVEHDSFDLEGVRKWMDEN